MTTDRKAVIALTISDRGALQAAYMSFVENGGVFVPTNQTYALGDDVFLLFGLMDESERLPVPGKVVWVSAAGGNNPAGIGVQFTSDASDVKKAIEEHLAGLVNSERATNTM